MSQPMFMASTFTGKPGIFVDLNDTIETVKNILNGEYDKIDEDAFYMIGGKLQN